MIGGNAECIKLLIHHEADIHAIDNEGEQPIHYAAAEGQGDIIALLVKGGR